MLEQKYRHIFDKYLTMPTVNMLSKIPFLSPGRLSIMGAIMGSLCAISIALGLCWWALFCLLLTGFLDMLDGSLARHTNTASPIGTVLDIVLDRYVEFVILFGLYFYEPSTRATMVILMLGAILLCVTSFLVVGIFSENQNNSEKSFHYSPGLIERAEAFFFFALMILLPGYFTWLAILFTILVIYTSFRRCFEFHKNNIAV